MCIEIDGVRFCDVLEKAPHKYNGLNLERTQHRIEENQIEPDDPVLRLIADTCGLDLDDYLDRTKRIRSRNLLKELSFSSEGIRSLLNNSGIYFTLTSSSYLRYVKGEVHQAPTGGLWQVSNEAESALLARLIEERYKRFRNRVDNGITVADLVAYPEHREWLPRAEKDLATDHTLIRYCRQFVSGQSLDVYRSIYIPIGQAAILAKKRAKYFEVMYGKPEARLARDIFDREDFETLEGFRWERTHLEDDTRTSGNSRSRKKLRRAHNIRVAQWKGVMRIKYEVALRESLTEYLQPTQQLSIAA